MTDRFDAAHRVPVIGGKCLNLHGHTWHYEITITSEQLVAGMVVEFGAFKHRMREWVEKALDHATMLGAADPLNPVLSADGMKLYRFGTASPTPAERYASELEWPTAESLAYVFATLAADMLSDAGAQPSARVKRVRVQETPSNTGFWESDCVSTLVGPLAGESA